MSRDEVLNILETVKEHISFKYEHPEEYNEALTIARLDIKSIQRLLQIDENNLSGNEREQEIRHIIASARRIAE